MCEHQVKLYHPLGFAVFIQQSARCPSPVYGATLRISILNRSGSPRGFESHSRQKRVFNYSSNQSIHFCVFDYVFVLGGSAPFATGADLTHLALPMALSQ
jgi:hypothetical protein